MVSLPFDLSTEIISPPYASANPDLILPVDNPATGAVLTSIRVADSSTTATAIKDSNTAFQAYRTTTLQQRSQYLTAIAGALEPHLDDLATLLCLENGKPKTDARSFDLGFAVNCFRWYAGLIDKLPTQFYDRGSTYVHVVREPIGVVAAVLPFNWPPIHTAGKIAPALAMGNTVVIKPGDQAPLTVMKMVEIMQTVLPRDTVICLPGKGPEVPIALIESPDVAMISFTGSTAAGKKIAEGAGKHLKRVALELGGKNAFVVFEDADVEDAVRNAVEGAFFNKGEACTASSRLLVHRDIYDKFVERMAAGVRKLRVGDGMDSKTHVGPQVSKQQQEKVLEYIKIGVDGGAKIAAQGDLPTDARLKDGYFVPPTLFKDVTRDMKIAQEEMFGAVVTVTKFDTEDMAVGIVNESKYGLTCVVYTKDMDRLLRMSRRVESGMVFLNNYRRNVLGIPFGGVKETGGAREHCLQTLDEYSTAKAIQMPSGRGELQEWRAVDEIFGDKS